MSSSDTPGDTCIVYSSRDGMYTLENGAVAYSQSHIFARVFSRCLPCSFRLPECPSFYGMSSLTAEAFL